MTDPSTPLTRDEALMWLNDQVGQKLMAAVHGRGGSLVSFGVLRHTEVAEAHHFHGPVSAEELKRHRDKEEGTYLLGDTEVDLKDDAVCGMWRGESLEVELGGGVVLTLANVDEGDGRSETAKTAP